MTLMECVKENGAQENRNAMLIANLEAVLARANLDLDLDYKTFNDYTVFDIVMNALFQPFSPFISHFSSPPQKNAHHT